MNFPNFAIDYRWRGERYRTVVAAPDEHAAAHAFRRVNPNVEFIGCLPPDAPDPDRPPERCGHGPDSCPGASARGTCTRARCLYGLKATA